MPRLFTGLEIPLGAVQSLALLQSGLHGARWISPENFHITLRFVGDVDGRIAEDFITALDTVNAAPFEIQLSGVGSFGGRKPRALWAGIDTSEPLIALQRAHENAARSAGLPPEPRNFTPHVTLARLKGTRPDAVATYLETHGGFLSYPFEITRFVLFSSRPSQGGGPYIIEEAYPFSQNNINE